MVSLIELPQADRLRQVPQLMLTEIDTNRLAHQLTNHIRNQHLAGMADTVDPSRLVQRRPKEITITLQHLARMNRHPDLERTRLAPGRGRQTIHGLQRPSNCRVGIVEHGDHAIAGVLEHPTTGIGQRFADDAVVLLERFPIPATWSSQSAVDPTTSVITNTDVNARPPTARTYSEPGNHALEHRRRRVCQISYTNDLTDPLAGSDVDCPVGDRQMRRAWATAQGPMKAL